MPKSGIWALWALIIVVQMVPSTGLAQAETAQLTHQPVMHAPRSVTVLADTCAEAGFLATLAMLQGNDAEQFMAEKGGKYRIL